MRSHNHACRSNHSERIVERIRTRPARLVGHRDLTHNATCKLEQGGCCLISWELQIAEPIGESTHRLDRSACVMSRKIHFVNTRTIQSTPTRLYRRIPRRTRKLPTFVLDRIDTEVNQIAHFASIENRFDSLDARSEPALVRDHHFLPCRLRRGQNCTRVLEIRCKRFCLQHMGSSLEASR